MDAVDKIAPGEPPRRADQDCEGDDRGLVARATMRVDDFDFELPSERIALRPARPRDSARLLLVDGRGDRRPRGARPARPAAARRRAGVQRHQGHPRPARGAGAERRSIGATLHKREGPREWQAFLRNARRARIGDTIDFGEGVAASVVGQGGGRLGAAPLSWRGAGRGPARARGADAAAALYRVEAARSMTRTAPITRRCSRGRKARWRRRPRRCTSPTG